MKNPTASLLQIFFFWLGLYSNLETYTFHMVNTAQVQNGS